MNKDGWTKPLDWGRIRHTENKSLAKLVALNLTNQIGQVTKYDQVKWPSVTNFFVVSVY